MRLIEELIKNRKTVLLATTVCAVLLFVSVLLQAIQKIELTTLGYLLPVTGAIVSGGLIFLYIHEIKKTVSVHPSGSNDGKSTEKNYQKGDQRFEAFMNYSPAVAWIKDSSGRYTYVNQEFCLNFSVEADDVLGKTDYDLLNHEVVDQITQHDNFIVENNTKLEIYEEVPGPDGSMHNWWVHKFPIIGNNGELFSAGIGFDVTAKVKAEAALAKSEKRYRLLAENTTDIVCLLDLSFRFLYVSPSVYDVLGYVPHDLINHYVTDYYADDEVIKLSTGLEILAGTRPYTGRFRKRDGSYTWIETLYQPVLSDHGEVIQYQGVSRDVSERMRIEHELARHMEYLKDMNKELTEARDLAERSVKIKDEFLASTSHEIRTPMNAIIGLTRLMLNSAVSPEQKEYLEAIAKSGDTLMTVLNDILDLSKIEAGKMTFEEIFFSPAECIRYAIDLMKPKAMEKNIRLEYTVSANTPVQVTGDPVRLNQVLLNLISNAIKFTHYGGVSLSLVSKEAGNGRYDLEFEISDTGIGIPADRLDSIFGSFVQGNKTIARQYGGTGLGLAIVKRLIELQGGQIQVKSEENQGTVFTFSLTYRKAGQPAEKQDDEDLRQSLSLTGRRSLLVEDNTINQLVAARVLRDFGMYVDIAAHGAEAIGMMENNRYDIVLMDLMMPEMDGFEATEYIRRQMKGPVSEIPIIAMSANPLHEEIEKSHRYGMNDYISKPFDTRNLFNKIVKLINNPNVMTGNSTDAGASEKITNLGFLRELAEGSTSFIEEILVMFIDVIPKNLDELEQSLQKQDWENMKLVAHKMKPNYGFVGVKAAEDIMQRIEKNVGEMPDRMLLSELLTHARELTEKCLVELQAELEVLHKQ